MKNAKSIEHSFLIKREDGNDYYHAKAIGYIPPNIPMTIKFRRKDIPIGIGFRLPTFCITFLDMVDYDFNDKEVYIFESQNEVRGVIVNSSDSYYGLTHYRGNVSVLVEDNKEIYTTTTTTTLQIRPADIWVKKKMIYSRDNLFTNTIVKNNDIFRLRRSYCGLYWNNGVNIVPK